MHARAYPRANQPELLQVLHTRLDVTRITERIPPTI